MCLYLNGILAKARAGERSQVRIPPLLIHHSYQSKKKKNDAYAKTIDTHMDHSVLRYLLIVRMLTMPIVLLKKFVQVFQLVRRKGLG
jgi:hypothetical protein